MIGMPSRIGYASLADREISSCFSASYSSGPLVSGQTRISRSLGSTVFAGRSVDVEFMARSTGFTRVGSLSRFPSPYSSRVKSNDDCSPLLQRWIAFGATLGEGDFGDGDQNFGA